MDKNERHRFFVETRMMRDIDDETIVLILKAEQLDVETASIVDCKRAVVKYQSISPDIELDIWVTDYEKIDEKLRTVSHEIAV